MREERKRYGETLLFVGQLATLQFWDEEEAGQEVERGKEGEGRYACGFVAGWEAERWMA